MSFTRRSFLLGAGSGLSLLLLTACTDPDPTPDPTGTPTPKPTAPVPEPGAMVRSSWSADSFTKGSHSFIKTDSGPQSRAVLATALIDRVFFAGEATSTERPASVAGARESGARAAGEVAAVTADGERIAVIGAGAAGAEAARLLALYGYDVVVLEATDRTGGRIHTVTDPDWPLPIELGAWSFDPAIDTSVLDQLERLGVDTSPLGVPMYRSESAEASADAPEVTQNTVGAAALATALAWAAEQSRDFSLQDSLDGSGATETASGQTLEGLDGAALLGHQLSEVATLTGAAASDLSSWYGVTAPAEEPPATVLTTGPLSALIDDALDGLELFLSTAVVGIAYSDDGVSLRLGTGESLSVDRAIVTVPLGVLQNNSIEFTPALDFAHRGAIAELGFGTVDTVWLRFDEPFWTTTAPVWNVVGTHNDITTWINLQPITGEPVLVGVVGGAQALRLADLSDNDVVASAMLSLEPFADPAL